MFCLYCGTTLPDDAVFCNKCSRRQDVAASAQATDIVVLSDPSLPEVSMGGEQSPAGSVPMVQGIPPVSIIPNVQQIPSTLSNEPAGQSASSRLVPSGSSASSQSSSFALYMAPERKHEDRTDSHTFHEQHHYAQHSEAEPEPSPTRPRHSKYQKNNGQQHMGIKVTGHVSRRTVVTGLLGGAVAAAGGLTLAARIGVIKLPFLPSGSAPSGQPVAPANVDFPMFGFDPKHTHVNPYERILNPKNVSRLVPYWIASTGDSIWSSPVVVDGVVYVGSFDGKVYAFDARTGRTLWTASTGGWVKPGPAVVNGVVYIGSGNDKLNDKLYALDAKTGRTLWIASVGDPLDGDISDATVANGIVYVGSGIGLNSALFAFDAKTGQALWKALGDDLLFTSPAISSGVVYASSDTKMYAFDAKTGQALWTYTNSKGGYDNSVAVSDGVVYACAADQFLSITKPVVGKLYAFNAKTGEILWTSIIDGSTHSSPAVFAGVVYVGGYFDGKLYAFDAKMGRPLWAIQTVPLYENSIGSPTVANGVIYAGSQNSRLYAFDAKTGKVLWTYITGGPIYSNVTVANGRVYVGSDKGKLYAFRLPPGSI